MSRSARLSFLLLCLLIVAPLALAAADVRPPATWQALDGSPAGAEARLTEVQRGGDSVSLSLSLPGFWASTANSNHPDQRTPPLMSSFMRFPLMGHVPGRGNEAQES